MMSGFSFISCGAAVVVESKNSLELQPGKSPQNLFESPTSSQNNQNNQSNQNRNSEVSLLGLPISVEHDIKLSKSSEARLVKKKKRAPKVGFARDDCAEDDMDVPAGSVYESSLSDSVSVTDVEPVVSSTPEEYSPSSFAVASSPAGSSAAADTKGRTINDGGNIDSVPGGRESGSRAKDITVSDSQSTIAEKRYLDSSDEATTGGFSGVSPGGFSVLRQQQGDGQQQQQQPASHHPVVDASSGATYRTDSISTVDSATNNANGEISSASVGYDHLSPSRERSLLKPSSPSSSLLSTATAAATATASLAATAAEVVAVEVVGGVSLSSPSPSPSPVRRESSSSCMFSGMSLSSPSSSGKERSPSIGDYSAISSKTISASGVPKTPSITITSLSSSVTSSSSSSSSVGVTLSTSSAVKSAAGQAALAIIGSTDSHSVPASPSSQSTADTSNNAAPPPSRSMLSSPDAASAYSSFAHLTINRDIAHTREKAGRGTDTVGDVGVVGVVGSSSSSAMGGVGGETKGGRMEGRMEESEAISKATALSLECSSRLNQLMMDQEAAGRQKSDMRRELQRLTIWLGEAKRRAADMEADQLRLATLEEFDQADSLTGTLDLLILEISTQTARCKLIEGETALGCGVTSGPLRGPLHAIHTAQARAISEVTSALTALASEEERQLKDSLLTRTEELAGDERRLRRERERIEVEEQYIAEEEKTLAEQTVDLEAVIRAQAGDTIGRKAQLEAQSAVVMSEIQELQRQLAVKMTEKSALSVELETVNDRINQVRRTFQRQIHRIEDRRVQLGMTQQSCSSDREAISASQRTHTQSVALIESMKMQSEGWCRRVGEDVAALTCVMKVLYPITPLTPALTPSATHTLTPAFNGMTEGEGTEGEGTQDERAQGGGSEGTLQAMRDRLAEVEASLSVAIKSQTDVTQQRGALESEAKEAQETGVKLETEKRAHAAARRFKEAALVAKEEKNVLQRREELQDLIARNAQELLEKIEEVSQLEASRCALSQDLSAVRRGVDAASYATLRDTESVLLALLHTLTQNMTHTASQTVSQTNGQSEEKDDSSLSGMALRLVDSKIQELRFEILDLEEIYPDIRASWTESHTQDLPHSSTGGSVVRGEGEDESEGEGDDGAGSGRSGDQQSGSNQGGDNDDVGADASHRIEGGGEGGGGGDSRVGSEVPPALDSAGESDISPLPIELSEQGEEAKEEEAGMIEEEKSALILRVKGMMSELVALEEQLLVATDTEDYELADTLDGRITEIRSTVAECLREAGMTEEDLS